MPRTLNDVFWVGIVLAAGCGARTGILVRGAPDAGRADASVSADAPAFDAPVPDAGDGCGAGRLRCRGVCADVTSSNTDCGACGHACAVGERCDSGTCRSAVPPILWAHALADAQGDDIDFAAPHVAVDDAGNVYVLTRGFSQTMPVDLGDGPIVPAEQGTLFVVSYDKNGRYRWFHGIGSPRETGDIVHGNDIAAAGSCIAVVGSFFGPTDFGHGVRITLSTQPGSENGFALCLDPASGEPRWDGEMKGPRQVRTYAVSEAPGGAVFVGGFYSDTAQIGPDILPNDHDRTGQCFTATYSSGGAVVRTTWAGSCAVNRAVYDARSSTLYATATIEDPTNFGLGPIGTPHPQTGIDGVLLRYGPSGEPEWQTLLADNGGNAYIFALALGPHGDVAVGGEFNSHLALGPFHVDGAGDLAGGSGFVATVDPSGHGTGLRAIPSWARGVAMLSDGSVLTAGWFGHQADFGGCQMTWSPASDYNVGDGFLVSTDSTGTCQWALDISTMARSEVLGGAPFESDYISDVTVSPSGHPVFVGCFNGSLDLGGVHLEATPIQACTTFVAEMAAP